MNITITKKPYLHALKLTKQVFKEKQAQGRKNISHKHLQSDLYSFIMQSVIFDHYDQPMPQFHYSHKLNLNDKNIDIKKVSYDNFSQRFMIMLNKNQFDKSKGLVDGYIFSNIDGNFKQNLFNGYQIMIPIPDESSVIVCGYADYEFISNKATENFFKDKRGKVIDSYYYIKFNELVPISKI